jgi:hypothetical protein
MQRATRICISRLKYDKLYSGISMIFPMGQGDVNDFGWFVRPNQVAWTVALSPMDPNGWAYTTLLKNTSPRLRI